MSELYRGTTIGSALTEALDELIREKKVTPALALQVLKQFDEELSFQIGQTKNKITLKGSLSTYRFCDEVWTFIIRGCQIKTEQENLHCEKLKIVAVNASK
eukprot:NODE_1393_length_1158_cov_1.181303.p1 type:complete len:101 gc:universal NODE_1393_length_1158_cov_1.181303:383-685(+)